MVKNDYVGGEGGKKSPKSDYVICEHSLVTSVRGGKTYVSNNPRIRGIFGVGRHFLWVKEAKSEKGEWIH